MDVSAVSGLVPSPAAKLATEAENWGPDNDGDADDTALTVKPFGGQPNAEAAGPSAAQPGGRPTGGGALYL